MPQGTWRGDVDVSDPHFFCSRVPGLAAVLPRQSFAFFSVLRTPGTPSAQRTGRVQA